MLGIPHFLTGDDVYDGYCIPAGSHVFLNIWYVRSPFTPLRFSHHRFLPTGRPIMHNPTTYPEPSKFKPERFLDAVTAAPLPDSTFRFGRRICPGRFFAGDVLWVAMASMLAAF